MSRGLGGSSNSTTNSVSLLLEILAPQPGTVHLFLGADQLEGGEPRNWLGSIAAGVWRRSLFAFPRPGLDPQRSTVEG